MTSLPTTRPAPQPKTSHPDPELLGAEMAAGVLDEVPQLARRISLAELGDIMAKALVDTGLIHHARKPAKYEAAELDHGIVMLFKQLATYWRIAYDPRHLTEAEARRAFSLLNQAQHSAGHEEHPIVAKFRAERATATGKYAEFLDVLLEEFDRTGDPAAVAGQIVDALDRDRLAELCTRERVRIVAATGPRAALLTEGLLIEEQADGLRPFVIPRGQSAGDTLAQLRAALAAEARA
ncbi:hypothetical protein [Streptomyces sp. CC228A]|uniref:hypothetical protein n=1 Tax=Streptomyces sp. CC228A TaxID=2898186 RepID=UPI001F38F6C3|nr:hypothetical protein [Streptomyces sp. CC228A]